MVVRAFSRGHLYELRIASGHGPVEAAVVHAWVTSQLAYLGDIWPDHRVWGTHHGGMGTAIKRFVDRSRHWNLDPTFAEDSLGRTTSHSGGPPNDWDTPPVIYGEGEAEAAVRTLNDVASQWVGGDAIDRMREGTVLLVRTIAGHRAERLKTKDLAAFVFDADGWSVPSDLTREEIVSHRWSLGSWSVAYVYMLHAGRRDLAEWIASGFDVLPENEVPKPPTPKVVPQEWVYFMYESDGDRVKIGKTLQDLPIARIRQHMTSSSQGRDLCVGFLLRGWTGLEKAVHERFEPERVPSKREWFFRRGDLAAALEGAGHDLAAALGVERFDADHPLVIGHVDKVATL